MKMHLCTNEGRRWCCIAKLSMGELAMDDIWFGGQTKTLNLQQGSNGSSAGSAIATVAGLVLCHWYRNLRLLLLHLLRGVATGLRPTFGSVARTGMNLAWTSDRIADHLPQR
jgi:Asp-tRNA(Asn)/Glu-tRNA(Gln) amidotransferase A subunit family amidase